MCLKSTSDTKDKNLTREVFPHPVSPITTTGILARIRSTYVSHVISSSSYSANGSGRRGVRRAREG